VLPPLRVRLFISSNSESGRIPPPRGIDGGYAVNPPSMEMLAPVT